MNTADIPQSAEVCKEILVNVAGVGERLAGPKFTAGRGLVAFVESLSPENCVKVLCLAFLAKKIRDGD